MRKQTFLVKKTKEMSQKKSKMSKRKEMVKETQEMLQTKKMQERILLPQSIKEMFQEMREESQIQRKDLEMSTSWKRTLLSFIW